MIDNSQNPRGIIMLRKYILIGITGIILIIFSSPTIFIMVRELTYQRLAELIYSIDEIDNINYLKEIYFYGIKIKFKDEYIQKQKLSTYDEYKQEEGIVNININQKDFTNDSLVAIRPKYINKNRYHGWINVFHIKNNLKGVEELAIVQRISKPDEEKKETWRWRILFINKNGKIRDEFFSYKDRSIKLYRVELINRGIVAPMPLSFKTDAFGWPTIFYPILYPFLTLLLGIGMAALSVGRWKIYRNQG